MIIEKSDEYIEESDEYIDESAEECKKKTYKKCKKNPSEGNTSSSCNFFAMHWKSL